MLMYCFKCRTIRKIKSQKLQEASALLSSLVINSPLSRIPLVGCLHLGY